MILKSSVESNLIIVVIRNGLGTVDNEVFRSFWSSYIIQ